MTKSERIRDLLDGVYRGPTWYGPTIQQNLEVIDTVRDRAVVMLKTRHQPRL